MAAARCHRSVLGDWGAAQLFLVMSLEFVPRNYGMDNRHIPVMGLYHTGIPTWRKVAFGDRKKLPRTKTHLKSPSEQLAIPYTQYYARIE